jgi:hypothetical protein
MSNVWLRPLFKTVRITSHFAHIEKNDGPSSVRLTASHSARATCAPDMAHKMWHGTILHSGRPNRIESRVELPPVLSTRSYRPRVPLRAASARTTASSPPAAGSSRAAGLSANQQRASTVGLLFKIFWTQRG